MRFGLVSQLLSDAWSGLQCMAEADDPRNCFEKREDYLECLHHRKEVRAPCQTEVFAISSPERDEPLTGGVLRQFTRLNAVYNERKRQLKAGIDVLKEEPAQ